MTAADSVWHRNEVSKVAAGAGVSDNSLQVAAAVTLEHTGEKPMYDTSNDLAWTTRRSAIEMLNEHLADAIDLHLQAKQAHWNIKGPNFVGLHELFDRVAAQADEYSDLIAERAVALGGAARGTLQAVSTQSQLREYPLEVGDWRAHVRSMQDALATFGRGMRKAIDDATALHDADTADLFTEISRGVDKSLWMVEAHVQEGPAEAKQAEGPSVSRAAS
jgi:starvation-inducible DNA-binding protein